MVTFGKHAAHNHSLEPLNDDRPERIINGIVYNRRQELSSSA
jgi:hypothetical protein